MHPIMKMWQKAYEEAQKEAHKGWDVESIYVDLFSYVVRFRQGKKMESVAHSDKAP